MVVHRIEQAFQWDRTELPMAPLDRDWFGRPLSPAAGYALILDPFALWLVAGHPQTAHPHPGPAKGAFFEGLWHGDVAELFIASPDGQSYLEFNLSPDGAWWLAKFGRPRERHKLTELPAIRTEADTHDGWRAAMAIPLDFLTDAIDFGPDSTLNVTMVLESPDQRFLSATDLGGGKPDFHRPQHFAKWTSPGHP